MAAADERRPPVIHEGLPTQLPDIDPEETQEWLDSLTAVVDEKGQSRARFLMSKLLERARELQVGHPATVSTPYVNTIPPENEPWFPGDEHIERRIRAYIRWNAAVMVVKANKHADGIGGTLGDSCLTFVRSHVNDWRRSMGRPSRTGAPATLGTSRRGSTR